MNKQKLIQLPAGYLLQKESFPLREATGIYLMAPRNMEQAIKEIMSPLKGYIPAWMSEFFENEGNDYSYERIYTLNKCIAYLRTSDSYDQSGFMALIGMMSNCTLSISMESMMARNEIERLDRTTFNAERFVSHIMTAVILQAALLLIHNEYAVEEFLFTDKKRYVEENTVFQRKTGSMNSDEYDAYLMQMILDICIGHIEEYVDLMIKLNYKEWLRTNLCTYSLHATIYLRYILGFPLTDTVRRIIVCSANSGEATSPVTNMLWDMLKETGITTLKKEKEEA